MHQNRIKAVQISFLIVLFIIIARLFYWQILSDPSLQAIADTQHQSTVEIPASRGRILASDGFPLANNQAAYTVFAYMPDIEEQPTTIANALGPLLAPTPEDIGATPSAELSEKLTSDMVATIAAKLTEKASSWIPLSKNTLETAKQTIQSFNINGIGFDEYQIRQYPEASMAAQILGFVGSDGSGRPKGYFGLEGRYNFELTGRAGLIRQEKDALGKPIVTGEYEGIESRDGRDLITYIDRGLQFLIERELRQGMERYQAVSGEVIVVDPHTGGILALASFPSFDPDNHQLYDTETYKNPAISDSYEPGSTFKTVVMASAINEKLVTPDTTCNQECAGPVDIGIYSIKTWNNEYNPGETMTEVLERSDNTGMVFVARKLGEDKLIQYIKDFGFGQKTNIDLEGETSPNLRSKWGEIDVATASFGQGLAVNSLQMTMAVAALANQGKLMEPHVVSAVVDNGDTVEIPPKVVRQVVTPETAKIMTQMMLQSAQHGDAKWAVPQALQIAGKTGTAQIPISGHYDAEKTMASFVGFAPASNPKFVMLVKLREPQTSQWASETAAPLWFNIAKQMFNYYKIPTTPVN